MAEARRWSAQGAREITLLGQNVNAYRDAGRTAASWGLGRLLATADRRACCGCATPPRIRATWTTT